MNWTEVEQFINEVRRVDKVQLINMTEEQEIIDNGEYHSTEYRNGFNDALEKLNQLIEDYYSYPTNKKIETK